MPSVSNPSRKLFTVDTGLASSLLQVECLHSCCRQYYGLFLLRFGQR